MLQDDGFIAKILVKEGEKDISVGTPLLVMVEDEESVASFSDYSASGSAPAPSKKDTASEESTAAAESSSEPCKHPLSSLLCGCYREISAVHCIMLFLNAWASLRKKQHVLNPFWLVNFAS